MHTYLVTPFDDQNKLEEPDASATPEDGTPVRAQSQRALWKPPCSLRPGRGRGNNAAVLYKYNMYIYLYII